ncbi:hypothetical protein [Streptomyces sp. NPDC004296]|uniref:hypothetical protein n=1 Tax=Streptomyces sp. NPDC004296 TaxID=3364697 RepID=UPI003682BC84
MGRGPDGVTPKPDLVRDESEQVRYLDDVLPVFEEEGVDSLFWFSFAGYCTPHRSWGPDPDLLSYGIVKILDGQSGLPASERSYSDLPWEPKKAFHALADCYRALGQRGVAE